MFKQAIGVLAAAMTLVGCGDVCSRAERVHANLTEKVRQCEELGLGLGRPFRLEECEAEFETCSDADKQAADDYLDCMDKVRTCTPDTARLFVDEVRVCADAHPTAQGCYPL